MSSLCFYVIASECEAIQLMVQNKSGFSHCFTYRKHNQERSSQERVL
ncbi:MAG: hypothetical protein RLZ07_463 [Pseudomonadota bacterium]